MTSLLFLGCDQRAPKPSVNLSRPKSGDSVRLYKPTVDKAGRIIHLVNGCGYNAPPFQTDLKIDAPTYREIDEIKNILAYTGIPMSFKVYSANVRYAIATIIDGERYIVYDGNLLDDADARSDTYWTSMSIIAHEIGHHLAGHTLKQSDNQLRAELEADKFSGFVLYRMGATINEATNAIRLIADKTPSATHPGRSARAKAIEEGWNSADNLRYKSAIPPVPKDLEWLKKGSGEFESYHFIFSTHNYWEKYFPIFESDTVKKVTYRQYKSKSGYDYWVSAKLYGIVIEKTEDGVRILVTGKMPGFKDDISKDLHRTILFNNNFSGGTGEVSVVEDGILEPGRKIVFAYDIQDSLNYRRLIYLKYLPGNAKIN